MDAGSLECIRCGGELEDGFIKDQTIAGAASPLEWTEGTPETSLWSGIKTIDKKRYYVFTYRCTKCGRLEFYT